MGALKVLGYSERGIFNSIVFQIREHPEKMQEFITALNVEIDINENMNFILLNEQSFSDFGNSDLVIIIEQNKQKTVIFVEGKVKTYNQKSYSLVKEFEKIEKDKHYKQVSSNIFAQLYYKYLLTQIDVNNQFTDSKVGKKVKKLGKNQIIINAYEQYIKFASKYYFVAILPDNDGFLDKYKQLDFMPVENIHYTSWKQIEELFNDSPCVKETFEYNKGQIY